MTPHEALDVLCAYDDSYSTQTYGEYDAARAVLLAIIDDRELLDEDRDSQYLAHEKEVDRLRALIDAREVDTAAARKAFETAGKWSRGGVATHGKPGDSSANISALFELRSVLDHLDCLSALQSSQPKAVAECPVCGQADHGCHDYQGKAWCVEVQAVAGCNHATPISGPMGYSEWCATCGAVRFDRYGAWRTPRGFAPALPSGSKDGE